MEFDDYTEDMEALDEAPEMTELDEMLQELPDWEEDTEAEGMDDALMEALEKSPDERNWMDVELVDSYRHPDYETQRSFWIDPETSWAMRDDYGDWIGCNRSTFGAQRPDLWLEDEYGIHIREDKCYHDINSLTQNIRSQTQDRREAFGEDVDLTYVVAPNFTVAEAERLQNYCENKLDVNLEWQLK